jgi:hypothetical protein
VSRDNLAVQWPNTYMTCFLLGKTKALGRAWIFAWFGFSLRYMAAFQYSAGILSKPVMPSLTRSILGGITEVSGEPATQEL